MPASCSAPSRPVPPTRSCGLPEGTPEHALFTEIKKLEALRAAHIAFDDAADVWLHDTGSDQVLGIGRYCRGEKILALFNFADDRRAAWLGDEEDYTDLADGSVVRSVATLPAGGWRWLAHQY